MQRATFDVISNARKPPLVAIVSYSRLERPFIQPLLDNVTRFAAFTVVSVGTRLYNGEPEDDDFLSWIAETYGKTGVRVVRYHVPEEPHPAPIELHNEARKTAVRVARELLRADDNFWTVFLDGDEIPDGDAVWRWWHGDERAGDDGYWKIADGNKSTVVKLANYWYFLDPRLVAEATEDSVVLVHSSRLTDEALNHPRERDGLCLLAPDVKRDVRHPNGRPMFHHYSWVRADAAGLLRKVANWGHSGDCDWPRLINASLSAIGSNGMATAWPTHDFVHGYPLRRLDAPRHVLAMMPSDHGPKNT